MYQRCNMRILEKLVSDKPLKHHVSLFCCWEWFGVVVVVVVVVCFFVL